MSNNKYSLKASSPYYLPRIKAEADFDKVNKHASEFRKELGLSCIINGVDYKGDESLSKLAYTRRVNKYEAWYASSVKPITDRIRGMDELILSEANKEANIKALIERTANAEEIGFKSYEFNVTKGGYRGMKKEFDKDYYPFLLDVTDAVAARIIPCDSCGFKDGFIYVDASDTAIEKYHDMVRWKNIDKDSAEPDADLLASTKWKIFVKLSSYKPSDEYSNGALEADKYYVSRSEYMEIIIVEYKDIEINGEKRECVNASDRYSFSIGSRHVGSWGSLDPKDGYGYNRMSLEALEYGKVLSSSWDKPNDPTYHMVVPERIAL